MLSEPLDSSTRELTPDTPDTSSKPHHGKPLRASQSPELLSQSDAGSPAGRGSRERGDSGLLNFTTASGGTRPKPSYQRIAEYESALSPSPKSDWEGPAFQVIVKKGPYAGTNLVKFPNEILTHIFSHLPASSLTSVSLVSKKFYNLVTTPHAWRQAFTRFFPGPDAELSSTPNQAPAQLREQRFFTRLTGLASWRSEYVLRTKLLRSLGRGKPQMPIGHASSRSNSAASNASAVVTYSSQMFSTVDHIHAVWDNGRKSPRFIHGAEDLGIAGSSDPANGKADNWGLTDPQALPQFAELDPGGLPFGFDDGPTGCPNVMSVSQPFGMVYGEGFPGGYAYYRAADEMRGRFLAHSVSAAPELGVPSIPIFTEAISAVWLAKSRAVPSQSDSLVGIMTGSTLGIVTTYSLGAEALHSRQVYSIRKGEPTARWVLCPGVPIIAIVVDDAYNASRKAAGRVWAFALNALGEVFYICETPNSALSGARLEDREVEAASWAAGRTAAWQLVESSRRTAHDDPYQEAEIHGSYSPQSSSVSMGLSKEQLVAETREIEKFLRYRPAHFRTICDGWTFHRRLEADFGGDDSNGAGEAAFVIHCGVGEGEKAEIKRFTRWRSRQASLDEFPLPKTPPQLPAKQATMASLFGDVEATDAISVAPSHVSHSPMQTKSPRSGVSGSRSPNVKIDSAVPFFEEWRSTSLSLKDHADVEITTSAVDSSIYAVLTRTEDPLETVNGHTGISHPVDMDSSGTANIPGHRARFLAIGTKLGSVLLWNMRGPQSTNPALCNDLSPLSVLVTDSPQITCLAISALQIVVGGNDGLIQAWDPLRSTTQPVRTIHSRFSSRARRRLQQAEASVQGVGTNLYAAGTIAIDPNPSNLRGMVSLGTHLRYWSYNSSAADQRESKKRRLRRSNERGSNSTNDKFTSRSTLMDYIATEQDELRNEKARKSREEARLLDRFGVGMGDLTEEEAIQYAEMISADTFQQQEERRLEDRYLADASEAKASSASAADTPATEFQSQKAAAASGCKEYDQYDHDLEEAIRLSMLDSIDESSQTPPNAADLGQYGIPITFKQKKSRRSASSSPSASKVSKRDSGLGVGVGIGEDIEGDLARDLEYALRLSLVEGQSRAEAEGLAEEEFPSLVGAAAAAGKGKSSAI